MQRLWSIVVICCLAWFVEAAPAMGAPLKTGQAFQQALAQNLGVAWAGIPLRSALESLAERQGIAIVLDRRVDPDQPLEFEARDQALAAILRQLAARLKMGVAIVDSTVYLGPPETAKRLATVAIINHEAGQKLPAEARRRLASLPEVATEALATPRELVEEWGRQTGVQLQGLEQIPHDLWPSLKLPKQSAAARAALFLAGFDLSLEFTAKGEARIVPLPERPLLTRTYPGGVSPRQRMTQLEKEFPEAAVEARGENLIVAARWEDHELMAKFVRGERIERPVARPGSERYSLKVERQTVSAIARTIAARAGKELVVDPGAEAKTAERVSFTVTEVTLDDLLHTLLDPVDLTFKVTERQLLISPKP
jgi:hypothetical protein